MHYKWYYVIKIPYHLNNKTLSIKLSLTLGLFLRYHGDKRLDNEVIDEETGRGAVHGKLLLRSG